VAFVVVEQSRYKRASNRLVASKTVKYLPAETVDGVRSAV
jgi:hypothetical protein